MPQEMAAIFLALVSYLRTSRKEGMLTLLPITARNRSNTELNAQFAPSSQLERSPSRNNSTLLLQKDKVIESLQLELAESQIKLTELEKNGDGFLEELKKELWEARNANARLIEDNESYQLLLSERTLNGDFAKGDFMRGVRPGSREVSSGMGSLADELGSVAEDDEKAGMDDMRIEVKKPDEEEQADKLTESKKEAEQDKTPAEQGAAAGETRKLKSEIVNLKDQNKALTLYIERIISRVLQHDGFERVFDKHDSEIPGHTAKRTTSENTASAPPTPPEKDKNDAPPQPTFLQRARSVVSGTSTSSRAPSRSRASPPPPPTTTTTTTMPPLPGPASASLLVPAPGAAPSRTAANEDPLTAPRIPFGRSPSVRGHRRAQSELVIDPTAASVVGNMYPPRNGGGAPSLLVPGSRQTVIGNLAGDRTATYSQNQQERRKRLSTPDSMSSEMPADSNSSSTPSSPRTSSGMSNYTGAVTTQSRLRPLRLVQEASEEEEAARKKANRSSWMSWFNRAPSDESKENRQP